MTWQLVQKSAAPNTITAAGTITATLPGGTTAGNLVIFKVLTGGSAAAPTSVTAGFVDRVTVSEATAPVARTDIYEYVNNPGGLTSASATLGNGGSGYLEEWTLSTGVPGAAAAFDKTGTLSVTTMASPSNIATSATLAASNELAVSACIVRFSASTNTTLGAGTGFTQGGVANNGVAAISHFTFDYEADTGVSAGATVTDGVTISTTGAGSVCGAIVTYPQPSLAALLPQQVKRRFPAQWTRLGHPAAGAVYGR